MFSDFLTLGSLQQIDGCVCYAVTPSFDDADADADDDDGDDDDDFSSVQDGIYALGKAHMRSIHPLSLRSFPNVALCKKCPMLV